MKKLIAFMLLMVSFSSLANSSGYYLYKLQTPGHRYLENLGWYNSKVACDRAIAELHKAIRRNAIPGISELVCLPNS